MRILIRTSKFAIWSRRFGSLALPLAVIPVLLHRERLIASENFVVLAGVAVGVAGLAVILAAIAFARLWVTGDRGWNRALVGLVLGLVCLIPVGLLAWQDLRRPMIPDLSTDRFDPPALISGAAYPPPGEAVVAAFPNMRTRTYPVDAVRVFELVSRLVAENDWEVRTRREPLGLLGAGQINALVMRPLGWRDEVAIRVVGRLDGARVDMRSRAPDGAFDFGGNGPRIEETLLALDGRITRLMRDAPDARPGEEAEAPPAEAAGD